MTSKRNRPFLIFFGLVILVLALAGTSVYFYHRAQNLSRNPNASSKAETEDLVAAVGKLVILPSGETPTIATVTDPAKLKGQAFFANATAGDKVLIYTDAKVAVLYDPSVKKIVTMSTINIGANTPGTTTEPAATNSATTKKGQ